MQFIERLEARGLTPGAAEELIEPMTSGRLLLLLATVVMALMAVAHARAAPLDADSCTKLEVERALLRLAGVEWDMEKGPEWAKTNLAPERLGQIDRLIEVEAQLSFRCREAPAEKAGAPAATKKETKRGKRAAAARKAASSRKKERRAPAKSRPAAEAAAK